MLARSRTPRANASLIRDARTSLKCIYALPVPLVRLHQRQRQFASSTPALDPLAGSVAHHNAYVFLHTHSPPSDPAYPARSKSPLWRALTLKARAWGGIVNFSWAPEQPVHAAYTGIGEEGRTRGRGNPTGEGQEAYVASVFSTAHGARLHVPEVSLANLDAINAELHALSSSSTELVRQVDDKRLFLYVCTHGSRDCRCGEAGGDVARALRAQIAKRGLADEVFVGDVAHVGGHKYAANVLVYPYGDWCVPTQLSRVRSSANPLPPLCPPFWRGRMGLDKDEQLALVSRIP
ncbi:Sucrase/ferredoxin-like-domain-containing protein [Daedaleopsis nitida]|nr:Sucrase/ferredoxin-like-domain-containing protein [Daedaleopsis nitida]